MCHISVPNLKEIDPWAHCSFLVALNWCGEEENEEKCEENWAIFRNAYLAN